MAWKSPDFCCVCVCSHTAIVCWVRCVLHLNVSVHVALHNSRNFSWGGVWV